MRSTLLILISLIFLSASGQEKTKIYLGNDDHTDFIWTAGAETYHKAFLETIDYYLNLADETDCDSVQYQSRWNCDGSYWMWLYERNRSKEQFERLVGRIQDGHISVPLNALTVNLGSTPAEAVIRGMYYPGSIQRKYGVSFPLAYQIENQTLSYGLGALWAGAGAKYSWLGICGCDTKVKGLNDRENYIYWWLGPDSSRILMKWYPLFETNQSAGGYAEARSSWPQDGKLLQSKKYPYNIVGLFGKGWDDLETLTREMIVNAKMMSFDKKREVIVSNEIDFFEDFEKKYGKILPDQSYGFGNEWEVYSAYMQETTSRMLRDVGKLRGAEALATFVTLQNKEFMDKYTPLRDSAWMSMGLFWDHDWGSTWRYNFVDERIKWQNSLEKTTARYVNTLHDDACHELGKLISNQGGAKRFYVFNPLGTKRTDIADIQCSENHPFRIIDLSTGREIQFDQVNSGTSEIVRIVAENVPAAGYKVYEIRPGKAQKTEPFGTFENNVIETPFYKLTIQENGSIISLKDKRNGSRELAGEINKRFINDLGKGEGKSELLSSGSESITIKISSSAPLSHITYITLYRKISRIDISNEINQNFSGTYSWAFGFNLKNPQVWHEEVGAVMKAAYPENGGHYSHKNGRYDWLTINHFADISDDNSGITISSPDCNFMQVGNSTVDSIDVFTPQIKILAGTDTIAGDFGIPFIKNQAGENHFLQRFSLIPHGKFDKVQSMKSSLEHQTPLICGYISGGTAYPEKEFSLLKISDPEVLLWTMKPAEEGMTKGGVVLRLWNLSDMKKNFRIAVNGNLESAEKLNHIETPVSALSVKGGIVEGYASQEQLVTLSLKMKK
jgi:alpha-mannosidase